MSNFLIKPATIEDSEKLTKFLQKNFYDGGEPLNAYLNERYQDNNDIPQRGLYYTSKLSENLSFIAVTPENEIIGTVINKNFKGFDLSKKTLFKDNARLQKIIKLMDAFEAQVQELEGFVNENEKRMSIEVISVDSEWRNQSIGRILTETTINCAKENGYQQIRSMCTSEYSARLFKKFGFKCVLSLKYEDYKEDGVSVFNLPPPHTHIQEMVLKLVE